MVPHRHVAGLDITGVVVLRVIGLTSLRLVGLANKSRLAYGVYPRQAFPVAT